MLPEIKYLGYLLVALSKTIWCSPESSTETSVGFYRRQPLCCYIFWDCSYLLWIHAFITCYMHEMWTTI